MLSLEETKRALNDQSITDEEALKIQDDTNSLVELIFEKWEQDRQKERLKISKRDSKV